MLGIMIPCWFLSMWMSNTATTAMMVPILNAILGQIKEARESGLYIFVITMSLLIRFSILLKKSNARDYLQT